MKNLLNVLYGVAFTFIFLNIYLTAGEFEIKPKYDMVRLNLCEEELRSIHGNKF